MKKEKGILAEYDGLDIDDVIVIIEKSFEIKFNDEDFADIKTYGDFETSVLSKIKGEEKHDCTSQQAFYKLRKIVSENFDINKEEIKIETKLDDLFPKKNRLKNIRLLEKKFALKNEILTHNTFQIVTLIIVFVSSFVFLFFNSFYALIIFSIGMILSETFQTNTFYIKNIREFSEFLKNENYRNSRRDTNSYNPLEIKNVIKNIFSEKLDIEKSKLNFDTLL